MQVDLILEHPEYRLQSRSRLSARDDEYKRVWMDGREPLYVIFRRIRNLRIAVRKEYYEAAFLLDRIAPELRRARSVYEIAAGHGMFGMFAAAMFRNLERVIHVDLVRPQSYERILEQVALDYPFVKPRSEYHEAPAGEGPPVPAGSLVVGAKLVVQRGREGGGSDVGMIEQPGLPQLGAGHLLGPCAELSADAFVPQREQGLGGLDPPGPDERG